MRLIFMGSGSFAVESLRTLLDTEEHELTALITQPDKPAGRGHRLRLPPTKELALERGLDVHQPERVRRTEGIELVRALEPECIVVVAYGQIIPKAILDIPAKGIINVHASLLPRYRGAAPIQWAIARGETETGVSTMLIDEGLDTGPVLLQRSTPILPEDTSATLEPRLAALGAELLTHTLARWEQGDLEPTPQNASQATLAPIIKKEDGIVDWSTAAATISDRVRAFDPWPVAQTSLDGHALKIWKARAAGVRSEPAKRPPGCVTAVDSGGFSVACGEGVLEIAEVQPAGKGRMPAPDFARGRRLAVGSMLGG